MVAAPRNITGGGGGSRNSTSRLSVVDGKIELKSRLKCNRIVRVVASMSSISLGARSMNRTRDSQIEMSSFDESYNWNDASNFKMTIYKPLCTTWSASQRYRSETLSTSNKLCSAICGMRHILDSDWNRAMPMLGDTLTRMNKKENAFADMKRSKKCESQSIYFISFLLSNRWSSCKHTEKPLASDSDVIECVRCVIWVNKLIKRRMWRP